MDRAQFNHNLTVMKVIECALHDSNRWTFVVDDRWCVAHVTELDDGIEFSGYDMPHWYGWGRQDDPTIFLSYRGDPMLAIGTAQDMDGSDFTLRLRQPVVSGS